MGWAQRLLPRSIAAQLMSLVALSELIGITLAAVTVIFLFDSPSINDTQKFLAGRVSEVAQLLRSTKTPTEADGLLAAARRGGPASPSVSVQAGRGLDGGDGLAGRQSPTSACGLYRPIRLRPGAEPCT